MTARRFDLGRRLAAPALACALLASGLAACGGDDSASVARTAPVATTTDGRLFAASSPWNQRVDVAPVAPGSVTALRLATDAPSVAASSTGAIRISDRTPVRAGLVVNTTRWTTLVVEGGAATRLHCRQQPCGDQQDRVPQTLRIPADAKPDPRYDGWMTVIQGDDAYDLWRARRLRDGTISYAFARRWDLTGQGTGDPARSAVRGSGLPLIAGLITEAELERGEIDHALAIALPAPAAGKSVAPAAATNGDGPAGAVPAGARLRLRAGVRLTGSAAGGRPVTRQQERARDAILVALRRYGAIVVDRSAVPALYARAGIPASALAGDELSRLHLGDFEVVRPAGAGSAETTSADATQETTP